MNFQLTMILAAVAYLVPVLIFEARNDYRRAHPPSQGDEVDHNFDSMWEAASRTHR